MKARRIWAFVISLIICLSVTAPAYADASQPKVTVKKGDTVYGICQSLGLDYNICKNTIMRLNGMEKESELSSIKVGSTLIFPASSKDCAESGKSGDDEEDGEGHGQIARAVLSFKLHIEIFFGDEIGFIVL